MSQTNEAAQNVCPKCGAVPSHVGDNLTAWMCLSDRTNGDFYQSDLCRANAALRDLAAARKENERLKAENDDYVIGVERHTRRLTELANKLGLEGIMFMDFGFSQFESALADRDKQIEGLRAVAVDAIMLVRIAYVYGRLTSVNAADAISFLRRIGCERQLMQSAEIDAAIQQIAARRQGEESE